MSGNAKKASYTWRVVDIVVAALIAIAGGVIFWAWSQGAALVSAPMNAAYPPLTGLYRRRLDDSGRAGHAHHPQAGRRAVLRSRCRHR